MAYELQLLACAVGLGLLQLFIAATLSTSQRGLAWNAGPRDGTPKELTGVAARMDRALKNFLETFPFFAAAVLAVVVAQRTSASTALGAQLYLWGRVAYVPLYAAGIPYVRTIAWTVSLVGLLKILAALF